MYSLPSSSPTHPDKYTGNVLQALLQLKLGLWTCWMIWIQVNPISHRGRGGYGPTWSRNLFCIYSIIAKLSSSWQVKLQLHLNWDSYIITVRKCTPYPPHFPPTRASILAMLYKHYWNWNWVYGPLGWFIYNLTLFPTEGGGVDMAPLDQKNYFECFILYSFYYCQAQFQLASQAPVALELR